MKTPEIVKWFNDWFLENEERLKLQGLTIDFAEKSEKYPEYFQSVNVDSDKKLGMAVVFDIGTCDIHTVELEGEESTADSEFINSENEMNEYLEKFVKSL